MSSRVELAKLEFIFFTPFCLSQTYPAKIRGRVVARQTSNLILLSVVETGSAATRYSFVEAYLSFF